LDPNTVVQTYRRSATDASDSPNVSSLSLSAEELKQMNALRRTALCQLVEQLLTPPFHPIGGAMNSSSTKSSGKLSRDELRMKRHRKARLRVEQSLASQNKPAFGPFESGEPMVTSDDDANNFEADNDEDEALMDPDVPLMSLVERPEGQLLLRRLLQDARAHKDCEHSC
uniref:BHLH domain-containing protein n=1 Tax=Echinostoma caproni TaxID=27848 RepID=A0A183ALI3_9TREM